MTINIIYNKLIAVLGLSPQILTETLYALFQNHPDLFPDSVEVITTNAGYRKIQEELFAGSQGKFFSFLKEYDIDPTPFEKVQHSIHILRDEFGNAIDDILTVKHNWLVLDQFSSIVRKACSDNSTRVIASIAGGRKTMSVLLASAMTLWGREGDRIFHVLVDKQYESNPDFYFPPKHSKVIKTTDGREIDASEARIEPAEIPFVRLRDIIQSAFHGNLPSDTSSIQNVVNKYIKILPIKINISNRTLSINDSIMRLSPVQFSFYQFFVNEKIKVANGLQRKYFSIPELWDKREELADIYVNLRSAKSNPFLSADFNSFQENFRSQRSKINKIVSESLDISAQPYIIGSVGVYADTRYGIGIHPEKIQFED